MAEQYANARIDFRTSNGFLIGRYTPGMEQKDMRSIHNNLVAALNNGSLSPWRYSSALRVLVERGYQPDETSLKRLNEIESRDPEDDFERIAKILDQM